MPLRRPCFAASLVTAPVNGIALSSPFHNGTESHDSLPLWHSSSFVFLVVALSPLPTFRRCAEFPCFCLTFRRCAIGPGPSVGPVRAFPFPVASFHLPKVRGIPAFPPHLPEVRTGMGCRITGCMYDFYTIFKKLDTCRMNFIQLNVFENCSSGYDTVTYSIRHNFCNE